MIMLIGLLVAFSFNSFAQTDDEEDEKVEKVRIVGSRISRIDAEPIAPVARLTRESLEMTGFSTVGDALRAVPSNSGQSLTPEDSSSSFTPGVSTFNLRGLGNGNTLVLINGRRAVPFAQPGFDGFQTVFDFNSMPIQAIEEIQILKDGGSAIYGSDAVAGVINIEFAKDFEGLSTQLSYGNMEEASAAEYAAFFVLGTSTAKTSFIFTADYMSKEAVYSRDLPYTANADTRPAEAQGTNIYYTTDDAGELITGVDWRSSRPYPARFVHPTLGGQWTFLNPVEHQNPDDAVAPDRASGAGYYNYQEDTIWTPEQEVYGFYGNATHQITDTLRFIAEASFRQVQSFNQSAPAPVTASDPGDGNMRIPLSQTSIEEGDLLLEVGDPNNPYSEQAVYRNIPGVHVMPAENPYNPFGQDLQLVSWRLVNGTARTNDVTVTYPRLVAGLEGEIGFDFEWSTDVIWSRSSYQNSGVSAFDDLVQLALRGVINPSTGVIEYANPFGPEPDYVGTYYTRSNPNPSYFDFLVWEGQLTGRLFDLPAGEVNIATGFEYREEDLDVVKTVANETGNIVGGSEGFGYKGDRDVLSLYAELDVPITSQLEAQVAVRYEDYSDFGDTTKPKVALKYKPLDWLLLRASFSQSFRAPPLATLHSAGTVTFTGSGVLDPKRPGDALDSMKQITPGNPDLQPEETDVIYAGIVLDFGEMWSRLDGLSIGADYFEFQQQDLLSQSATQTIVNNEDTPGFKGGIVVRRPLIPGDVDPESGIPYTVGVIDHITQPFYNADEYTYRGLDININYDWETENFGDFRIRLDSTILLENRLVTIDQVTGESFSDGNLVGQWNGLAPEIRANLNLAWNRGDWASSVIVYYVSGLDYYTWPAPDLSGVFRVNPQVSYKGLWGTRITVGVRNLFNEDPELDITQSNGGVLAGVYPWEKRFWYFRISKDF